MPDKGPFQARMMPDDHLMPGDACRYGVISLSRGVEICRVWEEDDARLIAKLLNDARTMTLKDKS